MLNFFSFNHTEVAMMSVMAFLVSFILKNNFYLTISWTITQNKDRKSTSCLDEYIIPRNKRVFKIK